MRNIREKITFFGTLLVAVAILGILGLNIGKKAPAATTATLDSNSFVVNPSQQSITVRGTLTLGEDDAVEGSHISVQENHPSVTGEVMTIDLTSTSFSFDMNLAQHGANWSYEHPLEYELFFVDDEGVKTSVAKFSVSLADITVAFDESFPVSTDGFYGIQKSNNEDVTVVANVANYFDGKSASIKFKYGSKDPVLGTVTNNQVKFTIPKDDIAIDQDYSVEVYYSDTLKSTLKFQFKYGEISLDSVKNQDNNAVTVGAGNVLKVDETDKKFTLSIKGDYLDKDANYFIVRKFDDEATYSVVLDKISDLTDYTLTLENHNCASVDGNGATFYLVEGTKSTFINLPDDKKAEALENCSSFSVTFMKADPVLKEVDQDGYYIEDYLHKNITLSLTVKNQRAGNPQIFTTTSANETLTSLVSNKDSYISLEYDNGDVVFKDEAFEQMSSIGSTGTIYYVYELFEDSNDASKNMSFKIGAVIIKNKDAYVSNWAALCKDQVVSTDDKYVSLTDYPNVILTNEAEGQVSTKIMLNNATPFINNTGDVVFWSETELEDEDIISTFGTCEENKAEVRRHIEYYYYPYYYYYYYGDVIDFSTTVALTEENPTKDYYFYLVRMQNGDVVKAYSLDKLTIKQNEAPSISLASSEVEGQILKVHVSVLDNDNPISNVEAVVYDDNGGWRTYYGKEVDKIIVGTQTDIVMEDMPASYKYIVIQAQDKLKAKSEILRIESSESPIIGVSAEMKSISKEKYGLLGFPEEYSKNAYDVYAVTELDNTAIFNVEIQKCGDAEDSSEILLLEKGLIITVNNEIIKDFDGWTIDETSATVSLNMKSLYNKLSENAKKSNVFEVHISVETYKATPSGNDHSFRKADKTVVLMVDDSAPEILLVRTEKNNLDLLNEGGEEVYSLNDIKREPIPVYVKVKDDGVIGIEYFECYFTAGSTVSETQKVYPQLITDMDTIKWLNSNIALNDDEKWYSITFSQDCKGTINLTPYDANGNHPTDPHTTLNGIIVETSCHAKLNLNVEATSYTTENGYSLYSKDVSIKVVIEGGLSGIQINNDSPKIYVTYSNGSMNAELNDLTFVPDSVATNLYGRVETTYNLTGIEDGEIKFYFTVTDNARNKLTSEEKVLVIDKTKPVIDVKFDDTTGDPDFDNYYSKERTATVTITERNVNRASVEKLFTATNGVKPTFTGWSTKKNELDPNKTVTTVTVTFSEEGTYNLGGTITDLAGNESNKLDIKEFTIDKTNPEINVTFDVNQNKSTYYATARTATISVTDKSFDPGRVSIDGKISNSELKAFPTPGAWTKTGDTYTAKITFDADGKYSFSYSVKDKAGNSSEKGDVQEFIVDISKPEIEIKGVEDKVAYRGRVVTVIDIDDINIDKSSIHLDLVGARNGKIDVSQKYSISEDGKKLTLEDFEYVPEMDDVYTLTITATDMAGNKSTKTIKFSINRFGSSYEFGDTLNEINEKFVKVVKGIKFFEINVDELKVDSIKVTLTINGVPKTLEKGKDYTFKKVQDSGAWNKYEYVLNDELFSEDGTYVITVSSVDMAENVNEISNKEKGDGIKFGVDTVAPIIVALNLENDNFYKANSYEALISIKDNLAISGAAAWVDGKSVQMSSTDSETYTFTIAESNNPQNIEIRAVDQAGNEAVARVDHVLVSGNILVRLMRNKLALFGILGGSGVVVVGGALFFILRRRF